MGNRWRVLTAIGGYIAVAVVGLLTSEEASSELIKYYRAVKGPGKALGQRIETTVYPYFSRATQRIRNALCLILMVRGSLDDGDGGKVPTWRDLTNGCARIKSRACMLLPLRSLACFALHFPLRIR